MTQVVNVSSALCCARGPQMVTADPGARDACCAPPVSGQPLVVDSAVSCASDRCMHATQIGRYLPPVLPCARLLARFLLGSSKTAQRRAVRASHGQLSTG